MPADVVLGWDIGGAHLKVAAVDRKDKVMQVLQLPCPLWLGLEHLDRAISTALAQMPGASLHAVTMTGELTDFFRNRAQGVKTIIARFAKQAPVGRTYIYAGPEGFLTPENAARKQTPWPRQTGRPARNWSRAFCRMHCSSISAARPPIWFPSAAACSGFGG